MIRNNSGQGEKLHSLDSYSFNLLLHLLQGLMLTDILTSLTQKIYFNISKFQFTLLNKLFRIKNLF
jgi:hypothetical protein